jgi:erythronate-4-phosphate dehydrogenase
MKPGSFLLNTSRGGVVETMGLKQQLSSGRLGGAVLDVWENEPTIDTELLSLTDIATAHIAGYSVDGKVNAARMIYEAACRFFGVPPTWEEVADLPPPEYRRIVVADSSGDAETVLLSTIKLCYDIEQDDRNIRTMLNHPESDRGDCFRKLRAGYRVRREFFNSTVILPESQQDLAPVLEALGFKVA